MAIKKLLLPLIFSFLFIPLITLADPSTIGTWTATNVTVYVHKDIDALNTTVSFRRDCSAGQEVTGGAKCPQIGYFKYPITDKTNPTSTFPYAIYKKSITREGLPALPDNNWKVSVQNLAGSHGTETINTNFSVSKVMNNTVVTFDKNKNGSNTTPTDSKPKDDPYDDPVPTPGGSSTGSSTATAPKAPLGISLGSTVSSALPSLTATKGCNTSTNKYDTGILKGLPCQGALKSLSGLITFVKNILYIILLPSAGVIFLIMFGVGGVIYITSNGNEQRIDRAKKTLTAAIIGLLIVTFAYVIIGVFAKILGGSVT